MAAISRGGGSRSILYTVSEDYSMVNYTYLFREKLLSESSFEDHNFRPIKGYPRSRYTSIIIYSEEAFLVFMEFVSKEKQDYGSLHLYFDVDVVISNQFFQEHEGLIDEVGSLLHGTAYFFKYNLSVTRLISRLIMGKATSLDRPVLCCFIGEEDPSVVQTIYERCAHGTKSDVSSERKRWFIFQFLHKKTFAIENKTYFMAMVSHLGRITLKDNYIDVSNCVKKNDFSIHYGRVEGLFKPNDLNGVLFCRSMLDALAETSFNQVVCSVLMNQKNQRLLPFREFKIMNRLVPALDFTKLALVRLSVRLANVPSTVSVEKHLVTLLQYLEKGSKIELFFMFQIYFAEKEVILRRLWLFMKLMLKIYDHKNYGGNGHARFATDTHNRRAWARLFCDAELVSLVSKLLVECGEIQSVALRRMADAVESLDLNHMLRFRLMSLDYTIPSVITQDIKMRSRGTKKH